MDERQARELLTNAVDAVVPSADLPERAERRYQRRRARSQVVVGAVVVALVGSGIATAAMVAGKGSATKPVSPNPTRPRTSGTVDTRTFGALAFVDATTGYGVATTTSGQIVLAKTDDGARTWRGLVPVPPETGGLALVPRTAGLVVWGQPGVYETSDEGAHWHRTLGYNADHVVASADRMWATVQCAASEGCSNKLMVSRDGGRTWSHTTERPVHVDAVATSAKAGGIAFVVELPNRRATKWEIAATTDGTNWTPEPTPCPDYEAPQLAVGGDGVSLMLVCSADDRDHVYVSANGGRTWTETVRLPAQGRVRAVASVNGAASTFVVGKSTAVGPGWDKGPLVYPVLDQWEWKARPQPIGDVRAFAFAPGGVMYFAASTGVWYQHNEVRELRTVPPARVNAVDPRGIEGVSFVSASVGFGLDALRRPVELAWTDDGGRTWRRIGALAGMTGLHFENATHGAAWGDDRFEVTTDGGNNWSAPLSLEGHGDAQRFAGAPINKVLTWAGDRIWAISFCDQNPACAVSRPVSVSRDFGRTWQNTVPISPGLEDVTIVAAAPRSAYVAGTDPRTNRSQLAVTTDGGQSWRYEPTPCGLLDSNLAYNGRVLLLVCTQGKTATQEFSVYTSLDDGHTWKSTGSDLFVGGYFGTLTNDGSTFVAAMQRGEIWSSPDGKTWHKDTEVGEGFWSISAVPGVGAFAATGPADQNVGILFSADGVHWQRRSRGTAS